MIPLSPVTTKQQAWALEILRDPSHKIGDEMRAVVDGVAVVARVSIHTWYGADPKKSSAPHRGVDLWRDTGATPRGPTSTVKAPQAIGVDVAKYQPTVDWPALRAAGYSFAIAKATEGVTYDDPTYQSHVAGARQAGLLVGAYHYFRTTSDPIVQVRHFVQAAGAVDLPLALDVEWQKESDPLGGMSPAEFASCVEKAIAELASLGGRTPLLYTAPGFWSMLPEGQRVAIASRCLLWLADYTPPADPMVGFHDWAIWQHTGSGSAPGLTGKSDLNRFCGSEDELRAWCATGALPPAPKSEPNLYTVIGIQAALYALGVKIKVDGIMGPATREAIIAFQRAHGLAGDGIVGTLTRAALAAAM